MARMPAGVTLRGKMLPEYRSILTPEALGFLAELHRRFDGERQRLLGLARRKGQSASARASCRIFCPRPAPSARAHGGWRPIPADLAGPPG